MDADRSLSLSLSLSFSLSFVQPYCWTTQRSWILLIAAFMKTRICVYFIMVRTQHLFLNFCLPNTYRNICYVQFAYLWLDSNYVPYILEATVSTNRSTTTALKQVFVAFPFKCLHIDQKKLIFPIWLFFDSFWFWKRVNFLPMYANYIFVFACVGT